MSDAAKNWLSVVGSSLGGYYAACLSERFALSAVLVNPADTLIAFQDYLGEHQNLYTGEVFELQPCYLDELRALDVLVQIDPIV